MQPSPRSKVDPPKDSSTSSQAGVEPIVNHEQAQPNLQQDANGQVKACVPPTSISINIQDDNEQIISIPLVQDIPETSRQSLELPTSPPKKLASTINAYLDKENANNVQAIASTSKMPQASTLPNNQGNLNSHLTKENKPASSTTSGCSNGKQQRAHQCSKIYQPKYPSPRAYKQKLQQVLVPKPYGTSTQH